MTRSYKTWTCWLYHGATFVMRRHVFIFLIFFWLSLLLNLNNKDFQNCWSLQLCQVKSFHIYSLHFKFKCDNTWLFQWSISRRVIFKTATGLKESLHYSTIKFKEYVTRIYQKQSIKKYVWVYTILFELHFLRDHIRYIFCSYKSELMQGKFSKQRSNMFYFFSQLYFRILKIIV